MSSRIHSPSTFALTTPLYYVNGVPHIGSAYTTIAADVVARYQRLQGHSVLLVTGTDEHGQKIQRTAEERGKTPQSHCDEIVESFQALWQKLNIRYDRFIRTTDPRHQTIVNHFFQRVYDNGDIYLGQQQGWYCVACEEFKEERDLLSDHICPIHTNRQAEWRDESNYFFRLSRYQEPLEALYAKQPDFIQPDYRRNEVLNFVGQGLQDFSISRVNLDWGFPIPTDSSHTIYVWFDALLGYLTALIDAEQEITLENVLSRWWPAQLHLIGKDILRFHAVYWPAMLMSAGLPLPQRVYGHGFLTKDGQKMGKSLGNTLDPFALVDQYGADAVRYFFMKEIEFGRDGDFNQTRFIHILNADLANDLGNLLNRTLKMVQKYCQGHVPTCSPDAFSAEHPLKQLGLTLPETTAKAYDRLAFELAASQALALARAGNKFIDDQAPWKLFKQHEQQAVEEVLYSVLESVRLVAYWLSPIIPTVSEKIYQQLGFTTAIGASSAEAQWGFLPSGQQLAEPNPIFQRLDLPEESSS